jgi:hypothetical protein
LTSQIAICFKGYKEVDGVLLSDRSLCLNSLVARDRFYLFDGYMCVVDGIRGHEEIPTCTHSLCAQACIDPVAVLSL